MSKLSYEDKINLYNERKEGKTISTLMSKYNVCDTTVEYIIRLIDRHGFDILKTEKTNIIRLIKKNKLLIVY